MRKSIRRIMDVPIVLVVGGLLYAATVANVLYYNIKRAIRRKTK
jgi:hypothetical protein